MMFPLDVPVSRKLNHVLTEIDDKELGAVANTVKNSMYEWDSS